MNKKLKGILKRICIEEIENQKRWKQDDIEIHGFPEDSQVVKDRDENIRLVETFIKAYLG